MICRSLAGSGFGRWQCLLSTVRTTAMTQNLPALGGLAAVLLGACLHGCGGVSTPTPWGQKELFGAGAGCTAGQAAAAAMPGEARCGAQSMHRQRCLLLR